MTRNRIFISYSHQDQDYLDELLKYLQHWQNQGVLDVWSDRNLEASQHWEQEIQQAIDLACVAVLLISQDFLNSAFIRERELPPLLQAREQEKLALACLHIRSSHVNDPDCVFPDGPPSSTFDFISL